MNGFKVEIEVPEALSSLGFGPDEIRRQLPVLLVMQRLREGAISTGKAAEVLGVNRREFLDLLARERIPLFDPDDEDMAAEFATVRRLASSGRE